MSPVAATGWAPGRAFLAVFTAWHRARSTAERSAPLANRSAADADAVSLAEAVYLEFLTSFPDSHILRKHGEVIAAAVLTEARDVSRQVAAASSAALRREHLFVFDARLKWQGINPGTSADLTVASLFAYWLEKREDAHTGTRA